jgi:polysaccharide export outer membrane protein
VLKSIKTSLPQITILLTLLILASCSYKRKNVLFKTPKKIKTKEAVYVYNTDSNSSKKYDNYRHRIKPGDRVLINFLNNYDIGSAANQSATSTANMQSNAERGYMVNYDSTITLPLIGRTNIVGLTRLEAAKRLEQDYGKYVINPIIEVNIASLSVTVLGEVSSPGKTLLDKETTTLVDVIALSGGFKDPGKKNRVKIIRGKEVILVDLRRIESLENKAIIIQDGDIVYIEPYGYKAQTEALTAVQSTTFVVLTISQLALLTIQVLNFIKQ